MIGFTKIIESGYDDHNDLYYLIMEKLDMDLNELIKKTSDGHLSLETTVNVGLELVRNKIIDVHNIKESLHPIYIFYS